MPISGTYSMTEINAYFKDYMYLYLWCLYKDPYCLLGVDFKTVGPLFLTQYTLLHLGSFLPKN